MRGTQADDVRFDQHSDCSQYRSPVIKCYHKSVDKMDQSCAFAAKLIINPVSEFFHQRCKIFTLFCDPSPWLFKVFSSISG